MVAQVMVAHVRQPPEGVDELGGPRNGALVRVSESHDSSATGLS